MRSRLTKHLIEFSRTKLVNPNSDRIKTILIFLSGFLTLLLSSFVPVAGGGVSLILVVTIPVFLGLALMFSLVYHFWIKKISNRVTKNIYFVSILIILIGLALLVYPYK